MNLERRRRDSLSTIPVMGELSSVPSHETQIQQKTLNTWIAEDPSRAISTANLLLTPRLAELFTVYIRGTIDRKLSAAQIATGLNLPKGSYSRHINESKKIIAAQLGLERPVRPQTLRTLIRDADLKKSVGRAISGNTNVIPQIIGFYPGTINSMLSGFIERDRPALIAKLTTKLVSSMPNFQWKDRVHFTHFLSKMVFNIRLDELRKRKRGKKLANLQMFIVDNEKHGPTDLLELWARKHPTILEQILSQLDPVEKEIYKLARSGTSYKDIAAKINSRSAQSVKVRIHRVKEKIRQWTHPDHPLYIPTKYKPLNSFELDEASLKRLEFKIHSGKVKGALLLNGRYFLTDQIFKKVA